jgi:putative salt-induced outer membrane protein
VVGDAAPAVASAPAAPRERPGLFGTRFLRGWERHIELGVNGSEGNTDEFDGIARLLARTEDERRRWKLDVAYLYSTQDNDTAEHKGHADLKRDWLREDSRWFQFGAARWDYDQFEDWSHRVALGGGVGYEIVDRPEIDVRTRLGLVLRRTFGGEENEIVPELLLGLEERWLISERVTLTASNELYPSLREPGELRNLTDVGLHLAVSEEDGLGVKLGVHNEYESDVEGGAEKNDVRYYGALVVDF